MSFRTEKLASVIKKDVGEILQKDYQPSGTFITVTQVRVTDDLSIAKVYLSVFAPGQDEEPIYRHIDTHQHEIRYKLAAKRSEEHTSELQSRGHLVCRLLLEKKKQKIYLKRKTNSKNNYNSILLT